MQDRTPAWQADSLPFTPPGKLTFSITIPVFKEFISFFYFRLCWVFVAAHGLSLVAERRLLSSDHAQPSHHSGFSCCSSQALRLSGCGTGAWLLHGMWNLPGPGIKPMFPALAAVLNYWTTREVPSTNISWVPIMWQPSVLSSWIQQKVGQARFLLTWNI